MSDLLIYPPNFISCLDLCRQITSNVYRETTNAISLPYLMLGGIGLFGSAFSAYKLYNNFFKPKKTNDTHRIIQNLPKQIEQKKQASIPNQSALKTSQSCLKRFGSRTLAVLESIPVFGLLIVLIERIVVFVYRIFSSLFARKVEQKVSHVNEMGKNSLEKMRINAKKALIEHRQKSSENSAFIKEDYIPSREELLSEKHKSLSFSHNFAEAQGPRDQMEDAHFYQSIPEGILAGVFDGHGGKEVAEYASQEFAKRFSKTLQNHKGDVYSTFTNLVDQIHDEVVKNRSWNVIGSTAVVCFVDKKTHAVYTATLGDSEANIYRKKDNKLVSIPLSCIRDWCSKKDFKRLLKAHNFSKQEEKDYAKIPAKQRRSNLIFGVNVSRAIGDYDQTGTKQKPILVHKPKITVNMLHPNDLLVLACDGLKDYVSENKIISVIGNSISSKSKNISQDLVNRAMKQFALDNVTVLTIKL